MLIDGEQSRQSQYYFAKFIYLKQIKLSTSFDDVPETCVDKFQDYCVE